MATRILRAPAAQPLERVHGDLFDAIVDQRLAPGTRLNELALSRVFGASRREMERVIARLAFEGLASLMPNRGAFVASPDAAEARAIFAARKAIEAGIVEAAAPRASGADFRTLEQNIAEEDGARRAGRMRDAIRLSGRFHLLLAAIAANPILEDLVRQLVARTSLVTSLYENPHGLSCWHDDHGQIVKHLRARRTRPAIELMRKHIDHLEESLDLERKPGARLDLRAIFRPNGARAAG
jgi:DNA-binding GntR family transcriptional regulator